MGENIMQNKLLFVITTGCPLSLANFLVAGLDVLQFQSTHKNVKDRRTFFYLEAYLLCLHKSAVNLNVIIPKHKNKKCLTKAEAKFRKQKGFKNTHSIYVFVKIMESEMLTTYLSYCDCGDATTTVNATLLQLE